MYKALGFMCMSVHEDLNKCCNVKHLDDEQLLEFYVGEGLNNLKFVWEFYDELI